MDKIVSATLKVVGVLIAIWLIYFLRDTFAYFLLAFLIAAALRPAVNFLERKKIPRAFGGVLIFILAGSVLVFVISLTLPLLISEVQSLVINAPQYFNSLVNLFPRIERMTNGMLSAKNLQNSLNSFFQTLSTGLTASLSVLAKFFGGLFNVVFILIITFFLTIEKDIEKKLSRLFFSKNKKLEEKFLKSWERAEKLAGRWIQGYLIAGTIVGILVYLGLTIIGVKYALIFAFLAGIFEIIPLIGAIIAGTLTGLFALSQGGLSMGLFAVAVFLISQGIQNLLITPFVMKNRVNLQPILVISVLFIGGRIGGTLGTILAVPVTAIIIGFFKENYPDYLFWKQKKQFPLKFK